MNLTFTHVHRYVHVNHMKTDSLSSPFAKNMHNSVQGATEEPHAAPETYLLCLCFDHLHVFS